MLMMKTQLVSWQKVNWEKRKSGIKGVSIKLWLSFTQSRWTVSASGPILQLNFVLVWATQAPWCSIIKMRVRVQQGAQARALHEVVDLAEKTQKGRPTMSLRSYKSKCLPKSLWPTPISDCLKSMRNKPSIISKAAFQLILPRRRQQWNIQLQSIGPQTQFAVIDLWWTK